VPILHVCGSLDPWLDSQTRTAQRRYRKLGGHFTVLIEDGKGHFPTAPRDPKPVVDFILARRPSERSGTRPRDYRFDRTMSRAVLENHLSRAISMEGLLNGRGDLDDNIRMLKATGARFIGRSLCLWTREANLLRNLERAKEQLGKVHAADPDMILQACIFESVSTQVEKVPVPAWAFRALGRLGGPTPSPTVPAAPWPTRAPIPDTPAAAQPEGKFDHGD
jgi:hypothetical protein